MSNELKNRLSRKRPLHPTAKIATTQTKSSDKRKSEDTTSKPKISEKTEEAELEDTPKEEQSSGSGTKRSSLQPTTPPKRKRLSTKVPHHYL